MARYLLRYQLMWCNFAISRECTMRQRSVMIMLRVKEGKGRHPFYPAVLASNGTVKPFYARIAGKEILRDDGVYYLRYTDAHSKRHYQFVGTDPKLARTMQYQRQHVIAGEAIGLRTVEPPPAPRPERIVPSELPSVLSLVNAGVPPPEFASKRLAVAAKQCSVQRVSKRPLLSRLAI
jgi:hypothetical protein